MSITLDPQQSAAASATETKICVSACPGAGKTRTIVERILTRGTPPEGVAVCTFTQAGAKEFAARLGGFTPKFMGTIHALMFRCLQRFGHHLGYRKRSITIIGDDTIEEMLDVIVRKLSLQNRLSKRALNERKGADAILVWNQFYAELKRNNCITYDRILEEGLRLMQSFEDVRGFLKVTDLYLDEAQDSGAADWAIIRAFPADNLFVVGDDDQAIYSFRGGEPKEFIKFASEAALFRLETNYRSVPVICEAAQRLILHNLVRVAKGIVPFRMDKGFATWHWFDHAAIERYRVLNRAARYISEKKVDAAEIAIITRTNHMAGQFREAAEEMGLPVASQRRLGRPQTWDRALTALTLMVDPLSEIAVERWLRADHTMKDVNTMKIRAMAMRQTLAEQASAKGWLLPRGFAADIGSIVPQLAKMGVQREALELVSDLIASLTDFSPAALLHEMWNLNDIPAQQEAGKITISTIHGVKGREFEAVFLAGAEEGTLPMLKQDTSIEEERRLFFVGVTRAKRYLHVTGVAQRPQQFGPPKKDCAPSRFIAEAGLKTTSEVWAEARQEREAEMCERSPAAFASASGWASRRKTTKQYEQKEQ